LEMKDIDFDIKAFLNMYLLLRSDLH